MEDEKVIELVNSLISALDAVTKAFDIPPTENGTVFSAPEVIGNAIITAGENIADAIKSVAKEIEIK